MSPLAASGIIDSDMTDLRDELAQLCERAERSYESVAAILHLRQQDKLLQRATEAWAREAIQAGAAMVTYARSGQQNEGVNEETLFIWQQPGKVRVEIRGGTRDGFLGIRSDGSWLVENPRAAIRLKRGLVRSDGSGGFRTPCAFMLHPRSMLQSLNFEPQVDRIEVIGRKAWRVRAVPRPREERDRRLELHALGAGADEFELIFDAKYGVLLRCRATYEGEWIQDIEAVELSFNNPKLSTFFDVRNTT